MFTLDKFPDKQPNEKIEILLRRHWLVFVKIIFVFLLIIILPLVFYFLLEATTSIFDQQAAVAVVILGGSIYYLYVLMFFFAAFLDYYLDVWIVTNKRVLNVEQKGLFNRVISEKELIKMQDITSEVKGFWQTFFDFGSVFIQTAGGVERFIFKQVPHPREVAKKVITLLEEAQDLERQEDEDFKAKYKKRNELQ